MRAEIAQVTGARDRTKILLAAIDAAGIPNDTALLDIREENGYLNVLCPADLRALLDALERAESMHAEAFRIGIDKQNQLAAVEALADFWEVESNNPDGHDLLVQTYRNHARSLRDAMRPKPRHSPEQQRP